MSSEDLKAESYKIESWVSKGKNGELQSSPEARKLAEKAQIKYTSKDAQDKLYREVFGTFQNKEEYNASKGEPFLVDSTDQGTGLLEALAKRSPILKATFKTFPDTRLDAYQNLFFKFEAQGADVNILKKGDKVTMKEGLVTVEYANGKKASALLFPWEEEESAPAPLPVAPIKAVEIPSPVVMPMAPVIETVKVTTPPPAEPAKAPIMPIDNEAPVEVKPGIDVPFGFEDEWGVTKELFKTFEQTYPQVKITDESADYSIGFDRPIGSKKIMISNNITDVRYILEVSPRKGATNYTDTSKLNFTVTELYDGNFNARNETKSYKFHGKPESLESAITGVVEYTAEIHDASFSLDSHIAMSTSEFHEEIVNMGPKQKLAYIQALLVDTKKKYEHISGSAITRKKDKVYLAGVQAEVNFLEKAYETLHFETQVWPEREIKSKQVEEILVYFNAEFEKTNR